MEHSDNNSAEARVLNDDVLQPRDRLIFWTLTVFGCGAIGVFLYSWFQLPAWRTHPLFMVVLFTMMAAVLISNLGKWWILPSMKRPRTIPARPGWNVAVVTTFLPGVEPLELLERTLKALVALDYPHETWVLDEGNDNRVKQLCAAVGVLHFSRLPYPHYQTEGGRFRKGSKHGNYNAWLYEVGFQRYDILVAFDPDHVPNRAFLSKVLGYFDDPRTGYVQAPQVYSNQQASFIALGAAEESYGFYSSVQMACYGKGFPLIIGCHTTHRLVALRECEGYPSHDADDLLLTLFYQNRGWQGVYVPEVLALGLAPANWAAYVNQQRRWTRSVLDFKVRVAPSVGRNLSPTASLLSTLHGINYVYWSIVFPLFIIIVALMLVSGKTVDIADGQTVITGLCVVLMLHLWERYRQGYYLDGKSERGFHWRARLLQFAKWPYQLAAAADVMMNRQLPYVATPKTDDPSLHSFVLWPHLTTLVVMGLSWEIGLAIHGTIPALIQLCAGVIVIMTLGLMATELKLTWASRRSASRSGEIL